MTKSMTQRDVLEMPSDLSLLWGDLQPGIEQTQALELAAAKSLFVLTGGPGVGKTATTRAIIHLFKHNGVSFTCLAPTGKAAQRMTELTGEPASTIHRAIVPVNGIPQKLITSTAQILDEMSMVDVELFAAFMRARPDNARLILVGDVDQLAPVGPGRVFGDLINSGKVAVARLTRIYRQASESRIPYVARDINEGRSPDLSLTGTDVSHIEVAEDESIEEEADRKDAQLANIQAMIVTAVTKTIPARKGIPVTKIQVLCAQKNRAIGVEEMNRVLQAAINPKNDRNEIWIGAGYAARAGDKVQQKRNNYDFGPGQGNGVFNGEIGIVEQVAADKEGIAPDSGVLTSYRNGKGKAQRVQIVVRFNEGSAQEKRIGFTRDEARDLHLAYACTIHSYQGSSAEAVVIPVHSTHHWMLTRKLVYTGITRAEKFMLFVGAAASVYKAARTTRGDERRTSLLERLNQSGAADLDNRDVARAISSDNAIASQGTAQTVQATPKMEIAEQSETNQTKSTSAQSKLLPGHYMVDGTTFRVIEKTKGGMAGKTLIETYDAAMDQYTGVAFVSVDKADANRSHVAVWKKHRDDLSLVNAISALASDPRGYGLAYAKKTGRCIICSRKLTDEASVLRGVGPTCLERWQ